MTEPVPHLLAPDGKIPNHPRFPLLVYPGVFAPTATSGEILDCFERNQWSDGWVNGVFSYHHFHSTAHEVLGCFAGEAQVQFGGESGPVISIKKGSVVVIPAGVGHKNLGASGDFGVVGAYPNGDDRDVCTGDEGNDGLTLQNIESVPLPPTDPVFGASGPLFDHWK